jgi:hypothetical protein
MAPDRMAKASMKEARIVVKRGSEKSSLTKKVA